MLAVISMALYCMLPLDQLCSKAIVSTPCTNLADLRWFQHSISYLPSQPPSSCTCQQLTANSTRTGCFKLCCHMGWKPISCWHATARHGKTTCHHLKLWQLLRLWLVSSCFVCLYTVQAGVKATCLVQHIWPIPPHTSSVCFFTFASRSRRSLSSSRLKCTRCMHQVCPPLCSILALQHRYRDRSGSVKTGQQRYVTCTTYRSDVQYLLSSLTFIKVGKATRACCRKLWYDSQYGPSSWHGSQSHCSWLLWCLCGSAEVSKGFVTKCYDQKLGHSTDTAIARWPDSDARTFQLYNQLDQPIFCNYQND